MIQYVGQLPVGKTIAAKPPVSAKAPPVVFKAVAVKAAPAVRAPADLQPHPVLADRYKKDIAGGMSADAAYAEVVAFDATRKPPVLAQNKKVPAPPPTLPAPAPLPTTQPPPSTPADLVGHPILIDRYQKNVRAGMTPDAAHAEVVAFDAARKPPQLPANRPAAPTPTPAPTPPPPTTDQASAPTPPPTPIAPGSIKAPADLQGHPILIERYKSNVQRGLSTADAYSEVVAFDALRKPPQLAVNKAQQQAEKQATTAATQQVKALEKQATKATTAAGKIDKALGNSNSKLNAVVTAIAGDQADIQTAQYASGLKKNLALAGLGLAAVVTLFFVFKSRL